MRECLVGLCLACASPCTTGGFSSQSDASVSDAAMSGTGASDSDGNDDRDHDGVCNATELALMSDPDRADTDGDGFPDYTEVMANFVLTNPSIPGPEQIAYLDGAAESPIDFEVRMTVD